MMPKTDLEAMARELIAGKLTFNDIVVALTAAFDAGAEAMQKRCEQIARRHAATRTQDAIRALDPSALRDGDK